MQSPREELQPYADFALVEFGWSEEKFYSQTPEQWQGVMAAWLAKERRLDRRTAKVCFVIARVNGNDNITEEDFMPKTLKELQDSIMDEQSPEEMFAALESVAPTQNGK